MEAFGIPLDQFLEFVRAGRVVPVFKFDLGCYDEHITRPLLEDLSLPYISPRDVDYLAARYIWSSQMYLLKFLRNDRNATVTLQEALKSIDDSRVARTDPKIAVLRQVLETALSGAEAFEGIMWRKGHLALGHYSPGALPSYILDALGRTSNHELAARQTVSIEAHICSMNLAMAQSMDAALFEGLTLNQWVMDIVSAGFRSQDPDAEQTVGSQLPAIVSSLRLDYANSIPTDEYLDLFDRPETKRIRRLVSELASGCGDRESTDKELRERVLKLNQEVAKLDRNALESAEVDVVGDLGKIGGAATGSQAVAGLISALGVPLVRKGLGLAAHRIIEDSEIGHVVDGIRGAINGVSGHAVRLYRVRKKLERLR